MAQAETDVRDAIIDRLVGFLGVGPHECADGWHWVYASRGVLEPLTPDEIAYFEDWTFPADRRAGDEGSRE
jgi:hypothetical protein